MAVLQLFMKIGIGEICIFSRVEKKLGDIRRRAYVDIYICVEEGSGEASGLGCQAGFDLTIGGGVANSLLVR